MSVAISCFGKSLTFGDKKEKRMLSKKIKHLPKKGTENVLYAFYIW